MGIHWQKGKDGKMHRVSLTAYKSKDPSKLGEQRISRLGPDGKRRYVKFTVAVAAHKKK